MISFFRKHRQTISKTIITLLLIGISVQVGLRLKEIYKKNLPLIRKNNIWEKRSESIRIVFGSYLDPQFLAILKKIPANISFQCRFKKKWDFNILLKYWYYPRLIGSDNRVICYFDHALKKLLPEYKVIYQDGKGNVITIKKAFLKSILAHGAEKKKWLFLKGFGK